MTEAEYQAQISLVIPAAPAPLLLLNFNPTRKRRPGWRRSKPFFYRGKLDFLRIGFLRLHWIAEPSDNRPSSFYPPLTTRQEYSHA